MSAPKSDLPQGTLDMLILQVVAGGPVHGYAIAQRLKQFSKDVLQVQQGSLYPALHRLENGARAVLSGQRRMRRPIPVSAGRTPNRNRYQTQRQM